MADQFPKEDIKLFLPRRRHVAKLPAFNLLRARYGAFSPYPAKPEQFLHIIYRIHHLPYIGLGHSNIDLSAGRSAIALQTSLQATPRTISSAAIHRPQLTRPAQFKARAALRGLA